MLAEGLAYVDQPWQTVIVPHIPGSMLMWANCCWISTGNADIVRLTLIYCNLQSRFGKSRDYAFFFWTSRASESKHEFPFWDSLSLLSCSCISIIRTVPHSITLDSVVRGNHSLVTMVKKQWKDWILSGKSGKNQLQDRERQLQKRKLAFWWMEIVFFDSHYFANYIDCSQTVMVIKWIL